MRTMIHGKHSNFDNQMICEIYSEIQNISAVFMCKARHRMLWLSAKMALQHLDPVVRVGLFVSEVEMRRASQWRQQDDTESYLHLVCVLDTMGDETNEATPLGLLPTFDF